MRSRDPTLDDFEHDMNRHANADYVRVSDSYVLELDSTPGGQWWLTVWKAVSGADHYLPPHNDDNRYAWDAVGRAEYESYDAGKEVFDSINTQSHVDEFTQDNPYDGPRKPYHERNYA